MHASKVDFPWPLPATRFRRVIVLGAGAGVLLAFLWEVAHFSFGGNLHTVVEGLVYRSGQLTSRQLENCIHRHRIRTVVNLRGACLNSRWYRDQLETTRRLGVNQEDLSLSAGRLPSSAEIRQLLDLFKRVEYPLLLHCAGGADRTGIAVSVWVLAHTQTSLHVARRHLGPRYGHLGFGRQKYLAGFLGEYELWLSTRERQHSQSHFRQWARDEYRPCLCRFELVDPLISLAAHQPAALRVRSCNISSHAWRFRSQPEVGIHAHYFLFQEATDPIWEGCTGLLDTTVSPGESIELSLALPPLGPGKYRLTVDLVDEQHTWFWAMGSSVLALDLKVESVTPAPQAALAGRCVRLDD